MASLDQKIVFPCQRTLNLRFHLCFLVAGSCKLEYCVMLWQVTEPLEDRMEQAQFSPPLSKQRVEFAVRHIKESSAVSLVIN